MSIYKRPPQRVRPVLPNRVDTPKEGTFLHALLKPSPTTVFRFEKGPIYEREGYFKLLKNNNETLGIPYVQPELPESVPYKERKRTKEPELVYGDRVQVIIRILKNGTVRVKVNAAIAMMYGKYCARGLRPPFKEILKAYKSHGFSEKFLERIKKKHDMNKIFATKVESIIDKIFDKKQVKRVKPVPKLAKVIDLEEEVEVEEEEDEIPEEEGAMDMEPDEEDEVVEEDEEEVLSDEET